MAIAMTAGAASSLAATVKIGDWTVEPDNGGAPYMLTTNDAGSMFGKWCNDGSCVWILVTANLCTVGQPNVLALLNTPNAVTAIEMVCSGEAPGLPGYFRWSLLNPDRVDSYVGTASQVAIAFAIQQTSFQVSRFATSSFTAAYKVAGSNPASYKRKPKDEQL